MKIAIQGHPTRGEEVIQILESLGGKNNALFKGVEDFWYFINSDGHIRNDYQIVLIHAGFKTYTLEEFEKEFPFKIGDKVVCKATPQILHTIVGISLDSFACMQYEIKEDKTGIITHCPTNLLIKYKEMQEERNITLTLDKAKEWYKKGGELKEIALQAYSEEELTKVELPKSWEEFCDNYMIDNSEAYFDICSEVCIASKTCAGKTCRDSLYDKNICPSRESAEAHLAIIQLEQLRDCYRGLFVTVIGMPVWCIVRYKGELIISHRTWGTNETFLSFQSPEIAEKYLKNFKPLIKQAGDLI